MRGNVPQTIAHTRTFDDQETDRAPRAAVLAAGGGPAAGLRKHVHSKTPAHLSADSL